MNLVDAAKVAAILSPEAIGQVLNHTISTGATTHKVPVISPEGIVEASDVGAESCLKTLSFLRERLVHP